MNSNYERIKKELSLVNSLDDLEKIKNLTSEIVYNLYSQKDNFNNVLYNVDEENLKIILSSMLDIVDNLIYQKEKLALLNFKIKLIKKK